MSKGNREFEGVTKWVGEGVRGVLLKRLDGWMDGWLRCRDNPAFVQKAGLSVYAPGCQTGNVDSVY